MATLVLTFFSVLSLHLLTSTSFKTSNIKPGVIMSTDRVAKKRDAPPLSLTDWVGLRAQRLLQHLMSYKVIRNLVLWWLKRLAKKHQVKVWKGYTAFQERWIYKCYKPAKTQPDTFTFATVLPDGNAREKKLEFSEGKLLKCYCFEQEFKGVANDKSETYLYENEAGKINVVHIWNGTMGNLEDNAFFLNWEVLKQGRNGVLDRRPELKKTGEAFQKVLKKLLGSCDPMSLLHSTVDNSCETPVIEGKKANLLSFLSEPGVQSILMIREVMGDCLRRFIFKPEEWFVTDPEKLGEEECPYVLHKRSGNSTHMVVKGEQEFKQDGYKKLEFHISDLQPAWLIRSPYLRVLEYLGEGNFGCVQAYKDQHGEKVAVKNFHQKKQHFISWREKDINCRIKEAQKNGTASEFLVRIREVFYSSSGPEGPELYVVMNCYPTSLNCKIDGGKLADAQIIQWIAQLFLALEYLHQKLKVVHRDVKPENILLDSQDKVKLTDFGTVRMENWSRGIMRGTYRILAIPGTRGYVAPELYANPTDDSAVPFSVDFYSMGVVYWVALGNEIPMGAQQEDDPCLLQTAVKQVLEEKNEYGLIRELVIEETRTRKRPSYENIRRTLVSLAREHNIVSAADLLRHS